MNGSSSFCKSPKVTLVTVTYNSELDLQEFFYCVKNLDYPNITLVIVDNNSQDRSLELIRKFEAENANVSLIINSSNLGIAAANNQGILMGLQDGSDWIVLINNDVSFPSNLLTKIITSDGERVNTPVIPYYDQRDLIWFKTGDYVPIKGFTGRHINKNLSVHTQIANDPLYTEYAPTCCMAVHHSVFEEVGIMDEDYFVYFDDTDFCFRLKKAEVKIRVVQDGYLYHKVGSSTGGSESLFTIHEVSKNRIIFLRKHFRLVWTLLFIVVFYTYYFYKYGIKEHNFTKFRTSIRSTFEGFTKRLS